MANRGWLARMPIWLRVPGIIALVLAGIVASTTLAGAAGVGGGEGPAKHGPVQHQDPNQHGPARHGPR